MRKKWLYIIVIILFISLYFLKDKVYLFLDNSWFYPDIIYKDYCKIDNSNEYNLNFDYLYTRVLYRDIYDFKKEITIYKGKNYNLSKNMAVVDEFGLIGIITSLTDSTSKVMLLTNKNTKISIKVNDMYGLLTYDNDKLIVSSLTSTNKLKKGDIVYTSGLASVYENIPVGVIEKENTDSKNIEYIITPFANINDLSYVAVLKGVK